MKVLINVVHPNLESGSRVNKSLLNILKNKPNITINNLYEKYPDFKIGAKKEQELLLNHDVIIFQFPMYWLSSPALLKEWFDVVLEYNFAYGENYKLENKIFSICTTAGGSLKEYSEHGGNKYSVEDFLKPFEGTASYTKMNYKKPFIVYETFSINDDNLDKEAKNYLSYINDLIK